MGSHQSPHECLTCAYCGTASSDVALRPQSPEPPPWQDATAEDLHLLIRSLGVDIGYLGITDVATLMNVLQGTLAELQLLPHYATGEHLDTSKLVGCARSHAFEPLDRPCSTTADCENNPTV